jgi:hypothetical protein
MRRVMTLSLVGVALSIALASEGLSAASAPNASVTDGIERGKEIHIRANNCTHGSDYTAYVDVTITRADGTVERELSQPSQATSPSTGTSIYIEMPNTGSYTVKVRCRHQFDGTRSGTWYEETEDLVVTGLTADERKKCKKKRTGSARRRCLRRERAD